MPSDFSVIGSNATSVMFVNTTSVMFVYAIKHGLPGTHVQICLTSNDRSLFSSTPITNTKISY